MEVDHMKCMEANEKIDSWIDGELAPEAERAVDQHLSTCRQCHRQALELKRLSEMLERIPARLPSRDLKFKTLDRFEDLVAAGPVKTSLFQFDWLMRTAMAMGMAAGLYTGCRLGLDLASNSDTVHGFVSSVLYFSGGLLLSWV